DRQVKVLAVHARQLGFEHDLVLVLIDVHIGVPGSPGDAFVVEGSGHIAGKKTIYFLLETSQIAKRVVTNDTHDSKPPEFFGKNFLVTAHRNGPNKQPKLVSAAA